ncbi:phosphotransferase enzyme family protein [Allokutzneria albata]|uniref:Ser/Thr protein kinase RdoA involved in Cpx stress response, MazF antagonist n=1 Tax=Allokutzneria albata TaxID=211114 RepID=A0A1G9V8L8_ALLAB|nr:phosphotransferase [Allokutzneria albata]SDM68417.1 Ser/Thr protein kinase RdoA involved in Cpx stress response, MazF antagonist [Allokutzneria albata]
MNRARRVALRALSAYPLADPTLRFVALGENTTFQVRARTDSGEAERFLLRVHRPMRHGRFIDSTAAISSELRWLTALREQTDLVVPQPVPTRDGELITTTSAPDVPLTCSVLRWMEGRRYSSSPRPVYLRRLGGALARVHNHADTWPLPGGFVRIRWDWETFFGDTMQYGGINAAQVWDLLPDDLRRAFDQIAAAARHTMARLDERPGAVGLIHADLHLDNALFAGDVVKLIDFDDCGIGYRLYDVAVALWELRHRDDYAAMRTALIGGYTAHRPLPEDDLGDLDLFIAVREVAFGLWFVGTAQVNPVFRDRLPRTLDGIRRSLAVVLRAG